MTTLAAALDSLATRRVILFGGKGGVGKTTLSVEAALRLSQKRRVILFTTDPASNLGDLVTGDVPTESVDADALYARFLKTNLEAFLELGDRGTYLDREELRRFFELSLPGIDELMAWMRIGELVEEDAERIVVVDTAPTGHTLRMLGAAEHFRGFAEALDAMQAKHRGMVRQFTRRNVRDAMDGFIEQFEADARRRRELLADPARSAFVPVFLSEPWVVEQTIRLIAEVREDGLPVPFAVLNRASVRDCARCERLAGRDAEARARMPVEVVDHLRFCGTAAPAAPPKAAQRPAIALNVAPVTFLAGKGGVGKTSSAASIALQLALKNPDKRYVVISVDPAHSLKDTFAHEPPPPNLAVETIDTRAKWRRFRETLGNEIDRAVDSLTPRGLTVAYDTEAVKKLIEIAPPGADELFAVNRLAHLIADESLAGVIVDTAPTGHFLRLLDLPRTAGEWLREFMRILLHYRELIAPGSLGEELVSASRSLKDLEATLHSDRAAVIVVTRPEPIVLAETQRLIEEIARRNLRLGGIIANYVTPANDCPCDQQARDAETAALATLGREVVPIERRDAPPVSLAALTTLVPLM